MLKSMTGYGFAKGSDGPYCLTVELKSVNNRYLDCSVRLPRDLLSVEETVKNAVSAVAARGKVDVFVTLDGGAEDVEVEVNLPLAERYIAALKSLAETYDLPNGITAPVLSRFPDVMRITKQALDQESVLRALKTALDAALSDFSDMRAREGRRLRENLLLKLQEIERLIAVVEERSPETVAAYRARLEQRLRETLEDRVVDEARVITECAIFADRVAVDEETVRLRSHVSEFRRMLDAEEPVGRKLDFLLQEFNREANTIGSKCGDAALSRVVVNLKAAIEKLREQVQNIE